MAQNDKKNNGRKTKYYVSPIKRIDLMSALIKAQAIEEENYTKQRALKKRYVRKLEAIDVLVIHALIGHRNNKTGRCDPSQLCIAQEIGRSVSTVQRSMLRLKNAGFVDTVQKFNGNEQLPSQCNLRFERGRPWLERTLQADPDDDEQDDNCIHEDDNVKSPVTEPSVTRAKQDDRPRQRCRVAVSARMTRRVRLNDNPKSHVTEGSFTHDRGVKSPVTDKLFEYSVNKPGEYKQDLRRSHERAKTRSRSSSKDRPSGAPANDDYADIDFTDCILELKDGLPPYEPYGDFKPDDLKRSRQGDEYQLKKLVRLGWTKEEIKNYLTAYRRDFDKQNSTKFARTGKSGKKLSSLLANLVVQCGPDRDDDTGILYGWRMPDRFISKPEPVGPTAANSNTHARRAKAVGDDEDYGF